MERNGFKKKVLFLWLVLAVWLPLLPGQVQAAGFALFQQGTAAMAQGNAFVAEANDPSAIFYNAAGITQLKRPTFYNALVFLYPTRHYDGPFGQSADTNHRFYHTGAFYFTYPFHERVVFGLGLFNPFGLSTAWPPTWAGRYLTIYSQVRTYNLNPTLAIKLLDNLSVGLGANVMWSSVTIKRKLPVVIPTRTGPLVLPDGELTLKGFGTGFGVNCGVLYEPVRGVKLGFAFRSETYVGHQGQVDIALPAFPGLKANTSIDGSAGLNYPPNATFGVSVNRFKPFTFNLDATWTGWSSYDQLQVNLNNVILVGGKPTSVLTQPKNWNDAWAIRFGVNYAIKEKIKLRAGYIFDMTPVPDSTFDPQVPDSNRHVFSCGADYKFEYKFFKGTVGLAYTFLFQETRTKNNLLATNGVPVAFNNQANGIYRGNNHSLGISISTEF